MKEKRNTNLLILGGFLIVAAIITFTVILTSSNTFLSFNTRAESPAIEYSTNQKQTTFFEKYPTENPETTAVPIPTNPPESGDDSPPPPQPTSRPGQPTNPPPAPTSVGERGTHPGMCPVNQPVQGNCRCSLQHADRQNWMCDSAEGTLLVVGTPSLGRYYSAPYPAFINNSALIKHLSGAEYQARISSGCTKTCIGYDKPIIYLYPPVPTYVSVTLDIPGTVTKSIPTYPTGGWKNVLAYPDGTLSYEVNTYSELFYESSVADLVPRKNEGIVIKQADLEHQLSELVGKLGLQGREKAEFMEYWLPRLAEEKSEAIFVRLLTHEEKNMIDTVNIEPNPDTFIAVLFEFYPVSADYKVVPMKLPHVPERTGFTAVEWGGSVMPRIPSPTFQVR